MPVVPTVAIPVLALLHVPPPVLLLSVVVLPAHAWVVPLLAVYGAQVIVKVATQPVLSEYDIVAVPPGGTPVTTPAETLATYALLVPQAPPEIVLPRVIVRPAHTRRKPVMGASGLIVAVDNTLQPPGNV